MNEHELPITIDTLGRYRVLRRIGRGGMGDVWLGEDPRLHRQVAIKTLPVRQQQDHEFAQRFEREARAAAALNHPHILPVHDYGRQLLADQTLVTYIVMPFIQGGSLTDYMAIYTQQRKMLMPLSESLTFLAQAASAIDYAHEQGIVHRDIKPENMLLREKNWLLLADFGIARMMAENERLTATGTGFGTATYMAPEQASGHAVSASDTYSLAVLAYQLFTGRLPFQADTSYAITIQHLTMPPPAPRQINPQISPACEQVLLRGLAKRPEERFPSASLFVSTLHNAFAGMQSRTPGQVSGVFVSASDRTLPNMPREMISRPVNMANAENYRDAGVSPTVGRSSTPVPVEHPTADPAASKQAGMTRRRLLVAGGLGGTVLVVGGGLATWKVISSHVTPPVSTRKIVPPDPDAPVLALTGFDFPADTLGWYPQGPFLASASGRDGWLLTWDIDGLLKQPHKSPMYVQREALSVSNTHPLGVWSSDGKYLALVNDGTLFSGSQVSIELDSFSGQGQTLSKVTTLALATNNTIQSVGWLQHNTYLLTAEQISTTDTIIMRVTTATLPQKQWALPSLKGPLTSLTIAPDGSTIALGLTDSILIGEIRFINGVPEWHQLVSPLKEAATSDFLEALGSVAWSADGQQVISAKSVNSNGGPAFWHWRDKNPQPQPLNLAVASNAVDSTFNPPIIVSNPAAMTPCFAVGYNDGSVLLWNAISGTEPTRTLDTRGINNPIMAMAWSNDGKWLAVSFSDANASILIWKV